MFHAYLVAHGAEDLFFTYRWLLLEMKREFPLDDAMCMLEVMWSTLSMNPPPDVVGLSLVDTPDWLDHFNGMLNPNILTNPNPAYLSMKGTRRRMTLQSLNRLNAPYTNEGRLNANEGFLSLPNNPACESLPSASPLNILNPAGNVTALHVNTNHETPRKPVDPLNEVDNSKSTFSCPECPISSNGLEQTSDIIDESVRLVASDSTCPDQAVPIRVCTEISDREAPGKNSDVTTLIADDADGAILDDSIDFVVVSQAERPPRLPAPDRLGGGNPFLMFLCLVTLLEQRDVVMSRGMDYNDMAVHYDRIARCHDVGRVLKKARVLYTEYLMQQKAVVSDNDVIS